MPGNKHNILTCLNCPINQDISGTGFSVYIAVLSRHIPGYIDTSVTAQCNILSGIDCPGHLNYSCAGCSGYISRRCRYCSVHCNRTISGSKGCIAVCGNNRILRISDRDAPAYAGKGNVRPGCNRFVRFDVPCFGFCIHCSGCCCYIAAERNESFSLRYHRNIPVRSNRSGRSNAASTCQCNIIAGSNYRFSIFSYRDMSCLGFSIYIAVLRRHIAVETNRTRFGLCGNILCSLGIAGHNNITVSAGNRHVFPGRHVSDYTDASVTAQCNVLSGIDCPNHLNRSCAGCSGYISCLCCYRSVHCNCTIAGSKGCIAACGNNRILRISDRDAPACTGKGNVRPGCNRSVRFDVPCFGFCIHCSGCCCYIAAENNISAVSGHRKGRMILCCDVTGLTDTSLCRHSNIAGTVQCPFICQLSCTGHHNISISFRAFFLHRRCRTGHRHRTGVFSLMIKGNAAVMDRDAGCTSIGSPITELYCKIIGFTVDFHIAGQAVIRQPFHGHGINHIVFALQELTARTGHCNCISVKTCLIRVLFNGLSCLEVYGPGLNISFVQEQIIPRREKNFSLILNIGLNMNPLLRCDFRSPAALIGYCANCLNSTVRINIHCTIRSHTFQEHAAGGRCIGLNDIAYPAQVYIFPCSYSNCLIFCSIIDIQYTQLMILLAGTAPGFYHNASGITANIARCQSCTVPCIKFFLFFLRDRIICTYNISFGFQNNILAGTHGIDFQIIFRQLI